MIDLNNYKLELTFPCSWCYKIVLTKTTNAQIVIDDIFREKKTLLETSNVSKNGKFTSYNITLEINSDEERLNYYKKLNEHKDVKMVL